LIDSLTGSVNDEMIRRTFTMDSPEAHEKQYNFADSVTGQPTLTVFDITAWRAKRFQIKLPP